MKLERCPITELIVGQCAHCKKLSEVAAEPEPESEERTNLGPWFDAQFTGGHCDICEARLMKGDKIRADGLGGYLCEECGKDESELDWRPRRHQD